MLNTLSQGYWRIKCIILCIREPRFRKFEKNISSGFGRMKKELEIYFSCYLRKLSRNRGKFSSTALVMNNI